MTTRPDAGATTRPVGSPTGDPHGDWSGAFAAAAFGASITVRPSGTTARP